MRFCPSCGETRLTWPPQGDPHPSPLPSPRRGSSAEISPSQVPVQGRGTTVVLGLACAILAATVVAGVVLVAGRVKSDRDSGDNQAVALQSPATTKSASGAAA